MLQNELLLASEAEKTSQRADLEDHIKTAQNSVEEKKEEISKLQKQLEQVISSLFDVDLLLYVPSQQLWSWRDGQFTQSHFFLGKLEQAVNQYFVDILLLVTDNNPS